MGHAVLRVTQKRPPGAAFARNAGAGRGLMRRCSREPAHPHRVGAETVVFSCFNQDQSLDRVDFAGLRERLSQNSVQEKLTKLRVNRCRGHLGLRPELVAQ